MAISRNLGVGFAAVVSALVLTGCASTYEVNVRNQADQPVTAEIREGKPKGASKVLKSRRIPPGDRAWLGPARSGGFKTVFLTVDFEGNVETPVVLKLKGGTTAVNVERADEGARGRVLLEEVRP
jgi:hypothetical protein